MHIYTKISSILTSHNQIKKCSDSGLVRKFRETNDNGIIGELFQRYKHLVFGVCMKYLKDEDEAKDAVMQVFEKILSELNRHEVQQFKGWLYMVTKNHCLMYIRNRKIHVELPENLTAHFTDDYPDEESHLSVLRSREESTQSVEFSYNMYLNGEYDEEKQLLLLENVINDLKEEQRICIELFYLQEKSYEEVATITGYTMKEVKSYIQNGKRNLKIIIMSHHAQQSK